jgi:MFS family permease
VGGRDMGEIMGVMTALGSLMSIFGPLWAGFTFDNLSPESPFLIGAVLFIGAFAMLAGRRKSAVQAAAPAEASPME